MTETTVVNVNTDQCDVYIGRRTIYGNPFILGKDGDRKEVLKKFKVYFYARIASDESYEREVNSLREKRLGCHCKPKSCHGDVYVNYLESKNLFDY